LAVATEAGGSEEKRHRSYQVGLHVSVSLSISVYFIASEY